MKKLILAALVVMALGRSMAAYAGVANNPIYEPPTSSLENEEDVMNNPLYEPAGG